jgi:hypothetical protein
MDNVQRGRRPRSTAHDGLDQPLLWPMHVPQEPRAASRYSDALDLRNRSLVDEDVVLTVESLVAAPCDLGQSHHPQRKK